MKANGYIKGGTIQLKGLRFFGLVITTEKSIGNLTISDGDIVLEKGD